MQKLRTCFFIATCLCLSQQVVFAEETIDTNTPHSHPVEEIDNSESQPESSTTVVDDNTSSTGKDILSELIIRPVAVLGSATGLALFVIASPISGLASIPEPHDVFKTTWDDFVVTPYHFAFRRPFGDYSVELN
ncbi:MAG: hypothetical protein GQ529_08830 [Methyloprofundus sp.]|nr:hypothetical protein [Methyloprofundus sp.]